MTETGDGEKGKEKYAGEISPKPDRPLIPRISFSPQPSILLAMVKKKKTVFKRRKMEEIESS